MLAAGICRTLALLWGSSAVDRTFQGRPDRFLVFADLLQDLTICPSEVPDIAAMLNVPPECIRTNGTSCRYSLMHAIAASAPGAPPSPPCTARLSKQVP